MRDSATARTADQHGFTLMEVVAAVFMLAVAMTALITWTTQSADRTGLLREKVIANWVAHNKLTELHIAETWPNTGSSNGEMEMAGQEWPWRIEIKETPDEHIRRADVYIDSPNHRGQLLFVSGFLPPSPLRSGQAVNASLREFVDPETEQNESPLEENGIGTDPQPEIDDQGRPL